MESNGKKILVCNCESTMDVDGKALVKALAKAPGSDVSTVYSHLCRSQMEAFEKAAAGGAPLVVACTQEAPLFLETLDELADPPEVSFANIRERAGWSKDGKKATAKMAALLAEAALDTAPSPSVTMSSNGVLLVIGEDETAIHCAQQVSNRLDVSVLITGASHINPPAVMDVPVFRGTIKGAQGHLGAFQITLRGYAPAAVSSRENLQFQVQGMGEEAEGISMADLILDLRGGEPLFVAAEKRDGYFNPDPGNPALVQSALLELTDMVGEFEKPRYVDYQAGLCAHSRSNITGCSRCLDLCPAGAITANGDVVAIDPYICGGCGACAGSCPTGAAHYALPADNGIFKRLRTMLATFRHAGGKNPMLLVHDPEFGNQVIDIMARAGRGLPASLLPFRVNQVTQVGLDFMLAAAAYGAGRTLILLPPHKEIEADGLKAETALANTVLEGLGYGGDRFEVLAEDDPQAVEDRLWSLKSAKAPTAGDFLPMGRKRAILGLALKHLHAHAPQPVDAVALPAGAPFGTIHVDTEGCTLCLSCVGACPAAAIKDNPEKPQLSFIEEACVQCGLCKATCPEKVISLEPRIAFTEDARAKRLIKEEEPFDCVKCGKPFGARSVVERMVEKLKDHPMFAEKGGVDRLRMCDECRVVVLAERQDHPFAGPPRPAPRTTDGYLREREELRALAARDIAAREEKDET